MVNDQSYLSQTFRAVKPWNILKKDSNNMHQRDILRVFRSSLGLFVATCFRPVATLRGIRPIHGHSTTRISGEWRFPLGGPYLIGAHDV